MYPWVSPRELQSGSQPIIDPASFRDPAGYVFNIAGDDQNIYRTVNPCYRKFFDTFKQSGLHNELIENGWLIPHKALPGRECLTVLAEGCLVLQTQRIPFISYPWEWCFSQLKEAALLTLKIQRLALQHGVTLKDASAFNIQFTGPKPVLIDSLSFEPYNEGSPWIAYRQFCQHFMAPLALMAYQSVHYSKFLQVFTDGMPLEMAASFLPVKSFFRPSIAMHIHMHTRIGKKHSKKTGAVSGKPGNGISKKRQVIMLDHMADGIRNLTPKKSDSNWNRYEYNHSYPEAALQKKSSVILVWIKKIQPRVLWDLGCNTGKLAEESAQYCGNVIALDSDHACIDLLFRKQQKISGSNLLPVIMDVVNPSPGTGWANTERKSLEQRGPADALLALALIHHLRITGNIPFNKIAQAFSNWSKWLLVEYIPKDDPLTITLMEGRSDIFSDYSCDGFTDSFSEYFKIMETETLPGSKRILVLMKSKTGNEE